MPGPLTRAALNLSHHSVPLAGTGAALCGAGYVVGHPATGVLFMILGLTFFALVAISLLTRVKHRAARADMIETLKMLVAEDAAPSVMTDIDGAIAYANPAARDRFNATTDQTLAGVLTDIFAQPGSVLYRLQNRALALGSAREEVASRGERLQISTHRIGEDRFLWRLDELGEWQATGHSGDHIGLPMMTIAASGTILFMNEAMRRFLGGRERSVDRVFAELPVTGGKIQAVRSAHGTVAVQVAEVALTAGRRELYLLPEPDLSTVPRAEWGIVEHLPIPLLKLGRDGAVALSNARARRLLGTEALRGQHLSNLVEGLGRPLDDWLDEAWSGRNLGRTETVHATRRDDDTFVQISLERVREEDTWSLIVVMNDATELKSLENQFVQSQKMQAIGQLAGGIAHDFNNVLTAISGHCDLLLMRHAEEDQDFADLTQISQNANRAAALVGQLLAFSRKQHLRPDVIDLADSMTDLTHLLGRLVGEKVTLDFQHDREIRPVRADKRKLEQVVMNLVVNARDAMADGGRIRLDVRNVYLDHALERDRVRVPGGDYVAIRVIDEGSGIAPDKVDKIFEPFYTTKGAGKGTGLGLSMAYGIMKQSGGFIFVDSVVGSGTTFTLYFPVHTGGDVERRDPATPEVAPAVDTARAPRTTPKIEEAAEGEGADPTQRLPRPTHEPGALPGGHVLLVEDEAPVRAFASRALRLRGYTVMEAASAEEALELLSDSGVHVDVVVTDVVMPGMDGPTWVSKALEDRPGVKVVFVSGYSEDSVSEHQKRIPNSVFLPKPFSLSELTATVSAQIH